MKFEFDIMKLILFFLFLCSQIVFSKILFFWHLAKETDNGSSDAGGDRYGYVKEGDFDVVGFVHQVSDLKSETDKKDEEPSSKEEENKLHLFEKLPLFENRQIDRETYFKTEVLINRNSQCHKMFCL